MGHGVSGKADYMVKFSEIFEAVFLVCDFASNLDILSAVDAEIMAEIMAN